MVLVAMLVCHKFFVLDAKNLTLKSIYTYTKCKVESELYLKNMYI